MALQSNGQNVSLQELESQVFTPGMNGSLKTDLISASRRQGMLAIPIEGLEPLIREVAAGHPVIVFENLGLSWWPKWHFAIVYGYDLPSREVIMHSGPYSHHHLGINDFEKSWRLGNEWGLVVLQPGQLSATANELAHVKAAAGLEQAQQSAGAKIAYQKILEKWPQSLGARVGLANLAFDQGDCQTAVQFLTATTKDHPSAASVWHNLAVAQGRCQMKQEAKQSAERAISLSPESSKESYRHSLQEWL
jgi:tetratricopeptide (TPR) repeat protein